MNEQHTLRPCIFAVAISFWFAELHSNITLAGLWMRDTCMKKCDEAGRNSRRERVAPAWQRRPHEVMKSHKGNVGKRMRSRGTP